MSHNKVLSVKKQNFKAQNLRFTIPLITAALFTINFHQAAFASNFDSRIAVDKATLADSGFAQVGHGDLEYQHHHHSSGLLPRILNLVSFPFKTQLANLLKIDPHLEDSQPNFPAQAMGGSLVRDFAPIYLSQATSSSTKKFAANTNVKSIQFASNSEILAEADSKLYTVKLGDTIDRIAKKHQISREEIITLNKIENSNIIFGQQRLRLPSTKIAVNQPEKITLTPANFPQNIGGQTIPLSTQSDYLADASLKENISQSGMATKASTSLQSDRLSKLNKKKQNSIDVVSSVNSESNQNLNSISSEAISSKLPPLPSPEEYLPEAFDGDYSWPAKGVLSSGYGWRWGRLHKGIDIAAPIGTPIFAAAEGVVVNAEWNSGGYGNLIKLQHPDGSITVYAHNNRILVSKGQKVSRGEQISEMGNTGFSTGSHLHFEIHSRNQGVVDPLALLD